GPSRASGRALRPVIGAAQTPTDHPDVDWCSHSPKRRSRPRPLVAWGLWRPKVRLHAAASRSLGQGLHELAVVQVVVEAAAGEQLLVRALLDDPAVIHHEDLVRVADRGEAMRDNEG